MDVWMGEHMASFHLLYWAPMSWAPGKAHLTASAIQCSPPPPTLTATGALIMLTVVQRLRGWASSLSLPDPSFKWPEQTLCHPPTADSNQLPLIWLRAAEFSFLSVSPSFRLSWLHPLSKQSNPGYVGWPLPRAHCFTLTPQAPCGFSSLCFCF